MSKLTEKAHWDVVHFEEQGWLFSPSSGTAGAGPPIRRKAAHAIKKLLGPASLEKMSGYDDYLLWDVILPKYVPRLNGGRVVEIGSAPGEYVLQFCRNRNGVPYGIEYSEVGIEVNRKVFRNHGYDPYNVIHADVFSEELTDQYKEHFDVVVSKGFIEHFEDLKPVIDRHFILLKPGGYLVVTVPNLRGVNNVLARAFDETAIPRHNTKIMERETYRTLFQREGLQERFCDYYGTFSFYLFTSSPSLLRRHSANAVYKLQPILNLAFRTFFGPRGAETSLFSPFLIYIGKKCEA